MLDYIEEWGFKQFFWNVQEQRINRVQANKFVVIIEGKFICLFYTNIRKWIFDPSLEL